MGRKILIILLISFTAKGVSGQTYSEVVSDSVISKFMSDVLITQAPYESAFNKLPKKVYYKPIHLRDANWDFRNLPDTTGFSVKFDALLRKVNLSNEDIEFLAKQYLAIKDTTWNLNIEKVSFKKKYRKKHFKYSIPIFNKDYTLAVFWRYQYCGSLCAYSELHTYRLVGGNWILDKLIDGWIS